LPRAIGSNYLVDDAFNGVCLDVSFKTDFILRQLFPDLEPLSIYYRDADSWLYNAPPSKRPRNIRRFLTNWLRKEAKALLRESRRDYESRRAAANS
jgi:hypothetical protein